MHISEKALDEFIAIYKEEFGEEISRGDASEMAFRLVTLYERLAKRLPEEIGAGPLMPTEHHSQQTIGFRT